MSQTLKGRADLCLTCVYIFNSWSIYRNLPVDVKNPDERVLFDVGNKSFVDVLHNPVEQLGIDVFGESITGVGGLQTREGLYVRLGRRL